MKNERRKRMTLLSNNTNTNEYNEFRNIMISATNISVYNFKKWFMSYKFNLHYMFNFDFKSKVQNNKCHMKISDSLTAKFSTGLVLFLHV